MPLSPERLEWMERFEQALRDYGGRIRFNRMGLFYLSERGFSNTTAERAAKDLVNTGRAEMHDRSIGKVRVVNGSVVRVPPEWEVSLTSSKDEPEEHA